MLQFDHSAIINSFIRTKYYQTLIAGCWLHVYNFLNPHSAATNCFPCADPKSFVRGCPTLIIFFSVERGSKNHQKQTIIGLPAKHETPLKWCFAGGPIMAHIECWLRSFVIFRGSGPVLGKPTNLRFFRGGSSPNSPPPPFGSLHGSQYPWIVGILPGCHGVADSDLAEESSECWRHEIAWERES